jgi:hypothetical protein
MSNSAHLSFARLCSQFRVSTPAISKAVISGKWLVAREGCKVAQSTWAASIETKYRNARPRQPLATSHLPLATRLHPFPLAVCALFAFLSLTPHLSAQTGLATLSGTVTDPTGALLPKAVVTVTNEDTGVTVKGETTRAGVYDIEALKPGRYRVIVEHQGFKQIEVLHLELHTQDVISRNFTLPVGASSETIQVNGNQNAVDNSPAVSMTVTREFVEDMPLNGRSFQDLIALTPGAVSSANGNGLYSINGQRDDANYFTVDGVSANTGSSAILANLGQGLYSPIAGMAGAYPAQTSLGTTQSLASVDALQEFTVQTSGYSAETGRQPGGQVAFTTRSGTNDFHGSLFDYFRNEALDANSWYNDYYAVPREPERQNDFGGTFGGPVTIPRIYSGKDKTFFFFSYEKLLLILPGSAINVVPDAAFRAQAGAGFQPFLNAMPLPNGPPAGNGQEGSVFTASYGNPNNIENLNLRVDRTLNHKVQIFGRYFSTNSGADNNDGTGGYASNIDNSYGVTTGANFSFSPSLNDQLRLNYTRDTGKSVGYPIAFGGSTPYPSNLLIPPQDVTGSAGTDAFMAMSFTNPEDGLYFSSLIPSYQSALEAQHMMNLVDTLAWVLGSHSLSFGADFRRDAPTYSPIRYAAGGQVLSFGDYQQANASFFVTTNGVGAKPVIDALSLFANDAWRVSPKFTVTYGLRWELNPVPGPSNGQYPLAANQVTNFATMQLAPAGTPPYQTRYDNFAPRLGLAWQVLPSARHPLTLRAGTGMFYDLGQNLALAGFAGYPFFNFNFSTNVPFPASAAALQPPPPVLPLVPPYGNIAGLVDPHLALPYTEEWNLSFDYALTSLNTLTLNYVGNAGKKLLYPYTITPATNPDFSNGVTIVANAAASKYDSLQIQDHGNLARGMQVVASYAWLHAEDNGSTENGGGTLANQTGVSLTGPQWGNSDNDIQQVLNLALNYRVPGESSNRTARALTGGWLLAARFSAQSGSPFTVVQSFVPASGTNIVEAYFPDVVRGAPIYLHGVPGVLRGWELNPAAFNSVPVDPTTGDPERQGTAYRNEFHGPAFWGFNTSMQRDFAIYDRLNLSFRVDAFNVFNHANLGDVNDMFPSSNFGQLGTVVLSTTGSPNPLYAFGAARSLQLSLKLHF